MPTLSRPSRTLLAAALLASLAGACNGGSRLGASAPGSPPASGSASSAPVATPAPEGPVRVPALALPADVALAPGESVLLPGEAQLRFVRVVSDSRCKPGQQCIWAGEVTVALELESASRLSALELSQSTRRSGELGDFDVALTGFGPCVAKGSGECASLRVDGPAR